MALQIGIVGLPNVGKSTLFSALTKQKVDAANYPFCTIDPNVGCVAVPDERLQALANIVQPKQIVPAMIEFVDIAGLVKGASQGEGLGNQFLSHIREVDAIAHVLRFFADPDIIHVGNKVDPAADLATVETELQLADLAAVEKMVSKSEREAKSGDKTAIKRTEALNAYKELLAAGRNAREAVLTDEQREAIPDVRLLTAKPALYVANVDEANVAAQPAFDRSPLIPISAKVEAELAELADDEAKAFLSDLGLHESGLKRLIHAAYETLHLQTFFTAGEMEVRAWTVRKGATAPEAAGVIHTDFEKNFIRAECIAYADFIAGKGEKGARETGTMRMEGKDYVMQDGDICHFHHGS